jgi:protein ImuB
VRTVDDLLRLPAGGVLERFGPAVEGLHRLASGDLWRPLRPVHAVDPVRRHLLLDVPETDAQRLLFIIKHLLDQLLVRLVSRGHALAALDLRLRIGAGGWSADVIRPASPTVDAVRLADLVRLHLDTVRIEAGVTEVDVEAGGVPAAPEQLVLAADRSARDLEAATRALDRLRARYGDDVVVCAVRRDGHLPEAKFGWEPVVHVRAAQPRGVASRPLIRRMFDRPMPLGTRETAVPTGAAVAGPFIVSGGWWAVPPPEDGGRETHRTYYFMEGAGGELWWAFFDQVRGRWYLQGLVE